MFAPPRAPVSAFFLLLLIVRIRSLQEKGDQISHGVFTFVLMWWEFVVKEAICYVFR